jgi:hypothetical protein
MVTLVYTHELAVIQSIIKLLDSYYSKSVWKKLQLLQEHPAG